METDEKVGDYAGSDFSAGLAVLVWFYMLHRSVAYVKNVNYVFSNGEKNPIDSASLAVKKLADGFFKDIVLRSKRTTFRDESLASVSF